MSTPRTNVGYLLRVESFASAVEALLDSDSETLNGLAARLQQGEPLVAANEPVSPEWGVATKAFELIFETASREAGDQVLGDLRSHFTDRADDWEARFARALKPSEGFLEREKERRMRDGFLPILKGVSTSIDLRVLSVDETLRVVPVVTARAGFDEDIAVNGAQLVFQMSVEALRSIVEEAPAILARLESLETMNASISVAEWARLQDKEGGEH